MLDYLSDIIPILNSAISIYTTKQQEKIALYPYRLEVYDELCKIKRIVVSLKQSKNNVNNPEKILTDLRGLINEKYPELEKLKVDISVQKKQAINDNTAYTNLIQCIESFFKLRTNTMLLFKVEINPFILSFSRLLFDLYHISDSINDTIIYVTSYSDFMENFDIFLKKEYKKIEKQLKL